MLLSTLSLSRSVIPGVESSADKLFHLKLDHSPPPHQLRCRGYQVIRKIPGTSSEKKGKGKIDSKPISPSIIPNLQLWRHCQDLSEEVGGQQMTYHHLKRRFKCIALLLRTEINYLLYNSFQNCSALSVRPHVKVKQWC